MINFLQAPVEGVAEATQPVAEVTEVATEATGAASLFGGNMSFWIMIIAMIAIMYFFMWRPEKKQIGRAHV